MKELMSFIAPVAVLTVACVHVLIGLGEMFLWSRPKVYRRLDQLSFTQEGAIQVAPIVANAGLYNLFLAAGPGMSIFVAESRFTMFFLVCVAIAGLYGAATLKRTTLFLQTGPAVAAALLMWFAAQGS